MEYKNYLEDCNEYGGQPVTQEEFYDQLIEINEVR